MNIDNKFQIENKLSRALGLLEGSLYIKEREDYNKAGLVQSLEEIKSIIEEVLNLEKLLEKK